MKRHHAQESLLEPIIVDNFAGGGGASTGIELATGRIVNIAINHDAAAILMHRTNHPHTEHLQASVWDVDPVEVCRGRHVGLAWFSPDCKHFSKAKGAALVDRNIRGLAWIELRWAALVRPDLMITENVEEFQTWGPVRKGKPVKRKAGQTFRRWVEQLRALGYAVEWRILNAADYGAPTTRKRLLIIARCDGRSILWPERTHAPRGSEEVRSGKCKPWKSAAGIIDWSIPCPSIFDSKAEIQAKYGLKAVRPLADNTLRRVIRGVDKFTIRSGKPFIVGVGGRSGACPPRSVDDPHRTITKKNDSALCSAQLIQYHTEQTEHVRAAGLTEPINTVDASNRYALVSAGLVEYYGNGNPLDVREPMHTATSHDREALTVAHIAEFKGQDIGQAAHAPLRTITASAGEFAAVHTITVRYAAGVKLGHWPEIRALLNRYCGYTLAENEVLLLFIDGHWHFIADIGLRMLSPRELYRAMGFPEDYRIDTDYTGKPYPKKEQVARCGNAVCPPIAAAVVRANRQDIAVWDIATLAELERRVAV